MLYAVLGIIPTEGFNPSDDGVILAQSYRLLQGQIPHLDFISIRPVGSAVLHSLHFISPLPLEISGRWLTLLQYLSYSLLWAWMIVRFTRIRKYRGLIFYPLIGITGFMLNQNFYNLFPWTTIDAIFWLVIALSFYLPDPSALFQKRGWLKVALITFFACLSALSRQTFALPFLILIAGLLYQGFRKKKWIDMILGFAIGGVPVFLYASILIMNSAMPLLFQQLTGRTEIFETGIRQFSNQFWSSPLIWFYILVILLLLLFRLTEGQKTGNVYRLSLIPIGRIAFAVLFIFLAFSIYMWPDSLFGQSFMQFWLLILLWLFEETTKQVKKLQRRLFFWAVLISWTSAISLGDNAPVFALGIINITALGYILYQFAERGFSFRRLLKLQLAATFLLVILIVLGIRMQKRQNYRDLSSANLEFSLKEIHSDFGNIRTNSNTYSYLEEIDRLYQELGFPHGRFVVLPNAAIIYPIMKTPNPMPVDWMQGAEFIGSEVYLEDKIREVIESEEIFFLIDKFDSKQIADTLIEASYPKEKYPYMDWLVDLTEDYPSDSKWFNIRTVK